jgi:hypothetical protein
MAHNAAMRRRLAILVLGALVATSAPALADTATATKAFEEGRKLRDQRDFEKAAEAFERSVAAERSIGAYYNLAFSYEQLGRTRDALDAYRMAAVIAKEKNDPREKEAHEAVGKLLDTHDYVTLQATDDVATTAGLRVVVDGEVVPPKQYKGEVFRAGSQHEVVVSAPGRKDVRLQANNKQVVSILLGDPLAAAPAASQPPVAQPPVVATTGGGWGTQKIVGATLVGAGVAAAVVGIAFVLDYSSTKSGIVDEFGATCVKDPTTGRNPCNSDLRERAEELKKDADANESRAVVRHTIAFGAAGLLVVAGAYLFLTARTTPTEAAPAPSSASEGVRFRVVPHVGVREADGTGLSVLGTF